MPEAPRECAVWENAPFLLREGDATWVAPGRGEGSDPQCAQLHGPAIGSILRLAGALLPLGPGLLQKCVV